MKTGEDQCHQLIGYKFPFQVTLLNGKCPVTCEITHAEWFHPGADRDPWLFIRVHTVGQGVDRHDAGTDAAFTPEFWRMATKPLKVLEIWEGLK